MKIILLSGGSGKRLWPLSNDSRSKQFLKLLESPNGEPESMFQRVIRQIREAGLQDHITVATSLSQKDIITNQLNGFLADVVTEPSRRDTFPAIALATSYLALKKHCSREEIIVVMPCDQYTDLKYFETVSLMAQAAESDAAELITMGIKPTYASTKFGYIVPEENVSENAKQPIRVTRFTEKPHRPQAETLLRQGALWNGGVFAFKLGYMIDIIQRYMTLDSFEQLYNNYTDLPKISFDYEVAERAKSVAVLPYNGAWKDLGTWNALTEELHDNKIGNVVLGHDNTNTHVINELDQPILCIGTKDLVVAANTDGILVCHKNESENIKAYADQLACRPMYEERRWGTYKVISHVCFPDRYQALTKILCIKSGCNISYQIHRHRDEIWTFIDGTGILVLDGEVKTVQRGCTIHIKKGQLHAVKAITDLQIIEVQSGDMLVEEDIERFDWEW